MSDRTGTYELRPKAARRVPHPRSWTSFSLKAIASRASDISLRDVSTDGGSGSAAIAPLPRMMMQRRMPFRTLGNSPLLGVQTAYPDSTLFDSKRVFECSKVLLGRDKKPFSRTGIQSISNSVATTLAASSRIPTEHQPGILFSLITRQPAIRLLRSLPRSRRRASLYLTSKPPRLVRVRTK